MALHDPNGPGGRGPSFEDVVAAFIEHGIARSLQVVEDAMSHWQRRDATALDTHSVIMRHAARVSVFLEEVARESARNRSGFLREAAIERLITPAQELMLLDAIEPGDAPLRVGPTASGRVAAAAAEPPGVPPTAIMNIARGLSNPDKSRVVTGLLGEGAVLVHIDARRDDVKVPAHFRGQSKLVLRFGYGLSPAIADLVVDDFELSGTLTFGGMPFHCVLPWHAVYAAVVEGAEKGHVWPEDVPELTFSAELGDADTLGTSGGDQRTTRDAAGPRDTVPPQAAQSGPKKRPSHLRLVD